MSSTAGTARWLPHDTRRIEGAGMIGGGRFNCNFTGEGSEIVGSSRR
jgi:hypothetical protein